MTWTRIIRSVTEQHHSSKEHMEHGVVWKLEGQSLVKVSALTYGFQLEAKAVAV
jgi:hypothetical protein